MSKKRADKELRRARRKARLKAAAILARPKNCCDFCCCGNTPRDRYPCRDLTLVDRSRGPTLVGHYTGAWDACARCHDFIDWGELALLTEYCYVRVKDRHEPFAQDRDALVRRIAALHKVFRDNVSVPPVLLTNRRPR